MVSSLISSIQGTLALQGPDWADVAVGGVTFRVHIPGTTSDRLGAVGSSVRLFTSLQVRDDNLSLYGFLDEESKMAFETLVSISGVGPRMALSVLSRFSPESLASAVSAADLDAFTGVPGVGKKTAGRIVLELKGKLEGEWAGGGGDAEAIEFLTALGYTTAEARAALASVGAAEDLSLEDRVRLAIQQASGT